MPTLVADCPRVIANKMTFDVTAQVFRDLGWRNWHEVFCVCRDCGKPTIFLIRMTLQGRRDKHEGLSKKISNDPNFIMECPGSLNQIFEVVRPIGMSDLATTSPTEYLPDNIKAAFEEGAACHAIGCYNAAACMFRLCLDHASKPLLPDPADKTTTQPNKFQRHNLGPRLGWLFEQKMLPSDLQDLASCVKDDGNDGAHEGTLGEEDADDLMDFTVAFLERLITEPAKVAAAKTRQEARRKAKVKGSPA